MNELPPFSSGTVPIPNRLFDEVLPTLKDTEPRVLLVVLRQTIGFREGSPSGGWRYKQRDWISYSQMVKKTGRGSEAVSKAIAALVARGLIIVEDCSGNLLETPEKRRRHLGRLYYRIGDMWKTPNGRHPGKAKTTIDDRNYINRPKRKKRERSSKEMGAPVVLQQEGWHRACDAPVSDLLDR